MAITISGENNNDRILAADGVIDQISGINIVGLITASHINVGSNIQLGNAGIITATTFVGNLTGNVNSTSPLLLQTGGSERFRITGNNELGIAGANYGSSGQVLTSGGSGSAVTWSTIPTQATINNNADNRVITGGSGVNLNGEANLTFNGSTLAVTGAITASTSITATNNLITNGNFTISSTNPNIFLTDTNNDSDYRISNSNGVLEFRDVTNTATRFQIKSDGKIGVGIDPTVRFHIKLSSRTSDFRITDSDSSADVLRAGAQPDGDGLLQLRTTGGAGPVLFDASGSSYIVGGNFGVGTVSPTRSFHVKGMASGNSTNRMMIIESTGTAGSFLAFQDANTTDDSKVRIGSIGGNNIGIRGDSHSFQDGGGNNKLVITSGGDLSLRTTTQNAYLGLTANSTAINTTLGSTAGASPRIYLKGTGNGQSDAGDVFIASGTGGIVNIRSAELMKFEVNSDSSTLEALRIASDGNVHINMTDNGTASAKLNVQDNSSAGTNVLLISNIPSGANGKARMVFHTETSQGQGCSPYIQSVSGTDAGPNASDGHNAGGFEFHTRSGGSGTDNNAMRIRDDGTVEKYGSVGQILLKPSGAEIEFTRGSSSNILCSHSAGFLNIYTGGQTTYPAMRIFATPDLAAGAKVGINTDTIGVDAQMYVASRPGQPGLYSSYGMRINPNGDGNNRISNATGVYALSKGITADNSWHTVAIGRYHAATVTIRVGDASSKRSMFINYDLTAPNYGVAHYNIIANNGNWNTGSSDFQLANSGSYDYALQVKHSSYYSSSNTAGVYMIFNVA